MREDGEVGAGGIAFDSAKGVEGARREGGSGAEGEFCGGFLQGAAAFGVVGGVVAIGALDDAACVGDFRGDGGRGDGEAATFAVGDAVLGSAQEDVAGGEAAGGCEELAVGSVEGEGDVGLRAGGHERGGRGAVPAEAGDAREVVEWDAKLAFAFVPDVDGGAVFAEVGAFEGDEEGV